MKKIGVILLIMIGVVTLSGCTNDPEYTGDWVALPDLNNKEESDVIEELERLNITYEIIYEETQVENLEKTFIIYPERSIGDVVNTDEVIEVLIYPTYTLDYVELPDLSGNGREDIVSALNTAGINYYFTEVVTENDAIDDTFMGYGDEGIEDGYYTNDGAIEIFVYDYYVVGTEYFEILELDYNGPLLSDSYKDAEYMSPRGGAFAVTLRSCTDGDTSKFNYPDDIYNAIQSSAKSVRFLNMDTEETYSGGEEEWGKPASVYTCSLLNSAEGIYIQTDPGDGLLDTHGRLLGWIWIKLPGEEDYFLLNYMVVMQGLAQVKYEFGAGEDLIYGDHTYNEWMHIAEDYAKANEYGQWSNLLDYYWDYENEAPYYDRWYN
jgi:hypothetical protein